MEKKEGNIILQPSELEETEQLLQQQMVELRVVERRLLMPNRACLGSLMWRLLFSLQELHVQGRLP